ncbi:MAG: MSMEG_1061 family FMN-dependent PPOX-type flavoprotein [Acidimicrobiia bacterium]
MTGADRGRIESREALRAVIGEPIDGVDLKVYDKVGPEARAFIARSPFLVLSTADSDGNLDASPKGDEPGFVEVEDEETLVVPDRPGNKLIYGLQNILENPHVGILFLVPGTTETLRVNGHAELRREPELLRRLAARGRPALLAIRVNVEECFFHCSKAFIRSKLWKPDTWPEKQKISFGRMFAERLGADDDSISATIDAMVEEDYRSNL